ncbi:ribonuclease T2 family protein [Endothiovibrio diazotrophicus]
MKGFPWLLVASLLLVPGAPLWASTPADGTFTATRVCEAYVSKNRMTNPDHTMVLVGHAYPVLEVNRARDPDWFRLRIAGANPSERWVSGECGTAEVKGAEAARPDSGGGAPPVCDIAGEADGYVFAVSWQPAFCATHRDQPECRITDPDSYQAKNFTLHGLWPNKGACGTRYGWCGEQKPISGDFCQYPPLEMVDGVRRELGRVMPSAAAGSCLQRHEWYKHGTCQRLFTDDGYFAVAVTFTEQFNDAGVGAFMAANVGKEVGVADFRAVVDGGLGSGASERLHLTCKGGDLVDVYMSLPQQVIGASLGELLAQGGGSFSSNCGARFRIDPIND